MNAVPPWWLCPNEQRCPHGAILHDVEDLDDDTPRCCVDGCDCGQRAGSRCSDNVPQRVVVQNDLIRYLFSDDDDEIDELYEERKIAEGWNRF